MEKSDLEPVFEAWYDHKMDPGDPELLRSHRETIDELKSVLETMTKTPLTRLDVKVALSRRFGTWMRENGLPSPPRDE